MANILKCCSNTAYFNSLPERKFQAEGAEWGTQNKTKPWPGLGTREDQGCSSGAANASSGVVVSPCQQPEPASPSLPDESVGREKFSLSLSASLTESKS